MLKNRLFLSIFLINITGCVFSSPNDDAVAKKFFAKAEQAKKKGAYLTQSQAHMSLKEIQKKIRNLPAIADNENIIQKSLDREKKYNADYSVFYHSVPPGARVFQDTMRELYKHKIGNVGSLADTENAFQFIRYEYKNEEYDSPKTADEFLTIQLTTNGILDDNIAAIKKRILSVNLSIFGNAGDWGESTYKYFVTPQTWPKIHEAWLKDCIKSFGYIPKPEYINELISLQNEFKSTHGDLFQFFIPNNKINSVGYLSWEHGIPFSYNFIEEQFADPEAMFNKTIELSGKQIQEKIETIKKGWQDKNPKYVEMVQKLQDNLKNGKYNLIPFLVEKYRKNPQVRYDYYQARLLITNDMLLNPESGIKIYRYSKLTSQQEEEYQARLNAIIAKIVKEEKKPVNLTALKKSFEALTGSLKKIENALPAPKA